MQDGLVRRVGEAAEHAPLVGARVLEQRERLVGVRREDDLVEALDPVADPQLDAVGRAADGAHSARSRRPSPSPPRSRRRNAAAAGHGAPAEAAEAEHPVILEEADRVRRRELERAPRRRRPERRGERHEEVAAEAPRVAALVEVLGERLRLVPGPRRAQPAPDLPEEPVEPRAGEVRGCANGRRPEYSSPQPEQLTENDMSDSCVATPSSRKSRQSSG